MCKDGEVESTALNPHVSNVSAITTAENIWIALCRYCTLHEQVDLLRR